MVHCMRTFEHSLNYSIGFSTKFLYFLKTSQNDLTHEINLLKISSRYILQEILKTGSKVDTFQAFTILKS